MRNRKVPRRRRHHHRGRPLIIIIMIVWSTLPFFHRNSLLLTTVTFLPLVSVRQRLSFGYCPTRNLPRRRHRRLRQVLFPLRVESWSRSVEHSCHLPFGNITPFGWEVSC